MLYRDMYNKHLTTHNAEITRMIAAAIHDKNLRLPTVGEKFLITITPVESKGQQILKLNAMVSSIELTYPTSERIASITDPTGNNKRVGHNEWWATYTKAGIIGIEFTKMTVEGKVFLRYHGVEAALKTRGARAYRVNYGARNTTGFAMLKTDHSYWVDPTTVCEIGTLPFVEGIVSREERRQSVPTAANNFKKPTETKVFTKPTKRIKSLAELGTAIKEVYQKQA